MLGECPPVDHAERFEVFYRPEILNEGHEVSTEILERNNTDSREVSEQGRNVVQLVSRHSQRRMLSLSTGCIVPSCAQEISCAKDI